MSWTGNPTHATLLELEPYDDGLTWGVWAEAWQGPSQRTAHWEVCFDDRWQTHGVVARGTAGDLEAAKAAAEMAMAPVREAFHWVKVGRELRPASA